MLLKDLFVFLPKSKRSASYGKPEGKFPFFTSSNTVDKYVDEPDYQGSYLIIGDGGTGNCKYYDGEFSTSDHNYVMLPKKGTNPNCVRYFLAKDNFRVLNEGFKGIGIKNISKTYIENIDYRYNSEFSDDYICQTLGKIEELINKDRSVLASLNELIKSRFNEMFGDIKENTKGFELVDFDYFVDDMHIGPFGSDLKNDCFVSKEDSYAMVYEQKHAIQKTMNVETRYINKAKFDKLKHFIVGPGDILVSCRGTLGECYVIPEDAPIGVIHPSLMFIRLKRGVNTKFILHVLERLLSSQEGVGSGVKMAIRASELAKCKTINPPNDLVESYLAFVDKIDKLKFSNQNSNT